MCILSCFIHVYVGSPGGWTQRCDLHESAGGCNYEQPVQDRPNLYWHRFKEEAPHTADLSLTPLFAHSRSATETLSFRELSVFSQHEEEEDRLNRFHLEAFTPIVSWLSQALGKECLVRVTHMIISYFTCIVCYLMKSLRLSIVSPLNDLLKPRFLLHSFFTSIVKSIIPRHPHVIHPQSAC